MRRVAIRDDDAHASLLVHVAWRRLSGRASPVFVPRRECLPLGRITLVGTARQARQGMSDKNLHVAAAIIVRDGAVLAAQRSHGMKDGWELPGGKLEPGETSEDACRREIREELGLELGVLWPFTTVRHSYPSSTSRWTSSARPSQATPSLRCSTTRRCAGLAETSCCPWTGCLQTSRWCARWALPGATCSTACTCSGHWARAGVPR